jgi:hypothetical protein
LRLQGQPPETIKSNPEQMDHGDTPETKEPPAIQIRTNVTAPPPKPPTAGGLTALPEGTDPGFPAPKPIANRPRYKIWVAALSVILAVGLGLVAFIFMSNKETPTFNEGLGNLSASPSFSYELKATVALSLGADLDERAIDTQVHASGEVVNDRRGIGDGTHRAEVTGTISDKSKSRVYDINGDARVIGTTAYLYSRGEPQEGSIDPAILREYWIAIPVEEIINEFSLKTAGADSSYGGFLGAGAETSFFSVLKATQPFRDSEAVGEDAFLDDGTPLTTIRLEVVPENMTKLVFEMLRIHTGATPTMTEDEVQRLERAWRKITISAGLDSSGYLRRFTFEFVPDDVMFGVITKGRISLNVDIPALGIPVSAEKPDRSLTMDELQAEISRYREKAIIRERDTVRVTALSSVQESLERYRVDKKRYPAQISELIGNPAYAPINSSSTTLSEIVYYGYLKSDQYSRSNRCTFKGLNCPAYHIGIDLEDTDDPNLDVDADKTGDILGGDTRGCSGAEGKSCLDRTEISAPVLVVGPSSTSTPAIVP